MKNKTISINLPSEFIEYLEKAKANSYKRTLQEIIRDIILKDMILTGYIEDPFKKLHKDERYSNFNIPPLQYKGYIDAVRNSRTGQRKKIHYAKTINLPLYEKAEELKKEVSKSSPTLSDALFGWIGILYEEQQKKK